MISFSNTEIAFAHHSRKSLLRAKFLFIVISNPLLITLWHQAIKLLSKLNISIEWLAKLSFYQHLVGGKTAEECKPIVDNLWDYRVYSSLYNACEPEKDKSIAQNHYNELLDNIKLAIENPKISSINLKPSSLISSRILQLVSEKSMLNVKDAEAFVEFKYQLDSLCSLSFKGSKPIVIEAEESWCQSAIEDIANEMMEKYNQQKAIVYRCFQMYQTGMLDKLYQAHRECVKNGYILGAKIIRGAYLDQEKARANKIGYKLPIFETKDETSHSFNNAIKYAISNLDAISMCCSTHNEDSIIYAISLMESYGISKGDSRIFFSQLYGMSDYISLNLADEGYNVAKYIPYGSSQNIAPYLMRRLQENTSYINQNKRELSYINRELKRRRLEQTS